MTPPRLLIAGSFGQGNLGDEAILAGAVASLRRRLPGVQLVVVSGDPAATSAQLGVETAPWNDWSAIAAALAKSDVMVLGGGGVFFDYTGFDPARLLENGAPDLAHYASFPVLARLLGKPLVIAGCGVGPLHSDAGRQVVRWAFESARHAAVRDVESRELLAEIGVDAGKVAVTADPAFALTVKIDEARGPLAADGPWIAVTARQWPPGNDAAPWVESLAAALVGFAASHAAARFALLPFDAVHDEPALRELQRRLASAGLEEDRVALLATPPSPVDVMALLARCELLVGMRLHSLLLATRVGLPWVGLAYDPKVRHLGASVALQQLCLGLDELERLPSLLADSWARRAALRAQLQASAAELAASAQRNADLVAAALAEPTAPRRDDALGAELARLLAPALLARVDEIGGRDEEIASRGRTIEKQWAELRQASEWLDAARANVDAAHAEAQQSAAVAREEAARAQRAAESAAEDAAAARSAAATAEARAHQLTAEVEQTRAGHSRLREQRDLLLQERNDVARRLAELEGTVGYALLSSFWQAARRLFPAGSRRRRLYAAVRRLARPLRRASAGRTWLAPLTVGPSTAGDPSAPALTATTDAPDPRADLLRFESLVAERGSDTLVLIVAATRLLESEGQRPTQIALDLQRRGVPVVFAYWRWWDHEWCPQDRLDQGIMQVPIDVVASNPDFVVGAFSTVARRIALFEFPWPGLFELVAAANATGWTTIYDVLDDWEEFHRVGQAVWYERPFEQHLLRSCDAVIAVNQVLADHVRSMSDVAPLVVGNGFKPGLEVVRGERPLPKGEVTVGYFGYLAGAWFDWQLVAAAARRRPEWTFHLVGYGGTPDGVELPSNVVLLGKQPQSELAAIAANWDVALVPFKPDRLAAGADPIKTYEYLAMGLPVVVSGVHPPLGAEELVTRVEDVDELIAAVELAARQRRTGVAARQAFAAASTWGSRVDTMLAAVESGAQRIAEKRALLALR